MTKVPLLWDDTLEHYTSYPAERVRMVAKDISTLLRNLQQSASLQGIFKKYNSPKFSDVATIPLVQI
jgi:hypothetical protein